MKIALIGDVHANLPALEAVLGDAHKRGVEAVWNVGDFVGYGAFPDEVVLRLQKEEAVSIIGNYDAKVLKVRKKKKKWKNSKMPGKWFAFNWAYDSLSKPSRKYLDSLPAEVRMEIAGKRILLTHGSPAANDEYIRSSTSAERLHELAELAEADIVISGHSHQPFKEKFEGVWFINTGSVGRPDDGDPRACYAIMQIRPGFFQLRHYRIEYDVDRAVEAIRERGLPEAFAQMMLQGRSLDAVLEKGIAIQAPKTVREPVSSITIDESSLEPVLRLAKSCEYEVGHTHQVTRLALRLFDELQRLHLLGAQERFWLNAGALLHDIGWIEGQKGHHKTALRTILHNKILPFDNGERLIIGSIARYHRGAMPKKKHSHFAALRPPQRDIVSILAAILRVADGLDRSHQSLVQNLSCEVSQEEIIIRCFVSRPAEIERMFGLKKGPLLEKVFERSLAIEWQQS
ncbi:YfcE family phosphodiesterase [Candidatus Poribacteria bacterium]